LGDRLDISEEIRRKIIHILTSLIPLAYITIIPSKEHIFTICVIMSIGFLTVDLLRMYLPAVKKPFLQIFEVLLREGEINNHLTGATYLFIGFSIAVFLFPREIAVPVMLYLSIADPCAAVIGKLWPVKKLFGKSLGGFTAFFISAAIITGFFSGYDYESFIIAFCTAAVEMLPLKINDNLTIPVFSGYLFMILK
jgi:phytol kinase